MGYIMSYPISFLSFSFLILHIFRLLHSLPLSYSFSSVSPSVFIFIPFFFLRHLFLSPFWIHRAELVSPTAFRYEVMMSIFCKFAYTKFKILKRFHKWVHKHRKSQILYKFRQLTRFTYSRAV